ncbi:hypothetical protein ACLBOM_18975 [Escherichia coli]
MDWLDAQCLYRTSELGQLTFPLWVILPEYTVSIRVESERYAMIIKVTPEGFQVTRVVSAGTKRNAINALVASSMKTISVHLGLDFKPVMR